MKTLSTETLENFKNSESVIERLTFAVIEQGLEVESFEDVVNHGINGGFSGFIYYSDTTAFYNRHKDDIWELAIDQADEMGNSNVFEMIAGFGGAKSVGSADQFENLMAWYAAEEVCRHVVDNFETEEAEEDEE